MVPDDSWVHILRKIAAARAKAELAREWPTPGAVVAQAADAKRSGGGGNVRLRVRGAASVLLKAGGTDAVRDELSSSGYERVQHHVEFIPHPF